MLAHLMQELPISINRTDSGMVNSHFSSMKNLPDQVTPEVFGFQHQATIGIDSPGNSAGIASIVLDQHLPSVDGEYPEGCIVDCCIELDIECIVNWIKAKVVVPLSDDDIVSITKNLNAIDYQDVKSPRCGC